MTQLKRLTERDQAEQLAEYRTGESMDDVPEEELEGYVKAIEGAHGDLDALEECLEDIIDRYDENDETMEQEAAVAVHRHLEITRRHASIPGLWHWLTIVKLPKYNRHRFPLEGALEEKYVGAGTDIYSNGLHRLWWFAELTREGDDYSRTELMLGEDNQYIVERIFDRSFARHEEAAKAAVDVLVELDGKTAEKVAKTFRHRETNYDLEGMDEDDIEPVLEGILAEVRSPS